MGKSIRIFLPDAEVSGIRHAEIVNWTGQALAFPRIKVPELKNWPEIQRQGVYFLLGTDEETGEEAVYIGEAEIVSERIAQHLSGKEFWNECVAFTSKDDNLTKSHIKYLESRLVETAKNSDRYIVKNGNTPNEPGLPRADKDSMDEFLEIIKTLLGTLGHKVLEPYRAKIIPIKINELDKNTNAPNHDILTEGETELFTCRSIPESKGTRSPEGFLVLKDSIARAVTAPTLSQLYKNMRTTLIASGVLEKDNETYKFTKDHLFKNSSQAASVIYGSQTSGPQTWILKYEDGTEKTLKQIEEDENKALEPPASE